MTSLFQVFTSSRMALVLVLGFSSGLPLALTAGTLQAWLTDAKTDLTTIGRFALVGIPYALKFLWAPLLDGYQLPGFGRRRGWALLSQFCLILSVVVLGLCDPAQNIVLFASLAFLVAFFSASQDIVLDAFRIEILKPEELGAGAGVYVMGYRLAMLVSGAVALGLASRLPWKTIYLLMACVMLIGVAAVLLAPEPKVQVKPPKSFRERVLSPFSEFFRRPGAMEILSFVMVYKLSTLMATALTTTFLMGIGFDKLSIAAVSKGFGLVATIVGTMAGGAMMTQLSMKRALWIFGILQSLAGLSFLLLTQVGPHHGAMILVITMENFMIGLGVAAISAFMMRVCSKQFTGTQFALLSSLTAVSRVVLVSEAGSLASSMGWPTFFVFSVLLAIPGLLLLTRFDRWKTLGDTAGQTSREAPMRNRIPARDLIRIAVFVAGLIGIATQPLLEWLWGATSAVLIARLSALAVLLAIFVGFLPEPSSREAAT